MVFQKSENMGRIFIRNKGEKKCRTKYIQARTIRNNDI